jgi:DNA-binding CsgD family transcriptional regulator
MIQLSHSDWGLVMAFIQKIHACRLVTEFPRLAVVELARLVPAAHVIWNYLAPSVPAAWTVAYPETKDDEQRTRMFAKQMHGHPVVQHMLRTGDPGSCAISDFWSEREFHQQPICGALYRDMRMEDQMGFWLTGRGPEMVGIGFTRKSRSFTERERSLLQLLRPHLAQAWRNTRSYDQLRRLALTGRRACLRLGNANVLLDKCGRVVRSPARARQSLKDFFCEQPRPASGLPATLEQWVRGSLAAAAKGTPASLPPTPFVREQDGRRLVARLFPEPEGWLLALERIAAPSSGSCLHSIGLTRREYVILLEVEKGRSNKEIAAGLFISPLTVRKHLENIFSKLGVVSRTAAIRVLHERLG